jgi:hypothetical protein
MIEAIAGQPFDPLPRAIAPNGLVGTMGVQILDDDEHVIVARTTTNITAVSRPNDPGYSDYIWNPAAAPEDGTTTRAPRRSLTRTSSSRSAQRPRGYSRRSPLSASTSRRLVATLTRTR